MLGFLWHEMDWREREKERKGREELPIYVVQDLSHGIGPSNNVT